MTGSHEQRERRIQLPDLIAASAIFCVGCLLALAAALKAFAIATGYNVFANVPLLVALVIASLLASVPLGVFGLYLIKPFERKGVHRFEPWLCPRCGYDRRGLGDGDGVCPECGHVPGGDDPVVADGEKGTAGGAR